MSAVPAEAPTTPSLPRRRRRAVTAGTTFGLALVVAVTFAVLDRPAGLWGLVPIVTYAVLAVAGVDVVLATAAALVVAAVMTRTGPLPLGEQLAASMGALVPVIGLIVMLGAGLGQVARETGAAATLVHVVMRRIGLTTPTRVQVGIMLSSLLLVGALGTLAGANALLAPIVIPVAARARWRPPAVAAMFHAAGAAGLMTGPFTPPVVTVTAAAGIGYGPYLLFAGGPVALVTLVTGFFMARWIQKRVHVEYPPPTTPDARTGTRTDDAAGDTAGGTAGDTAGNSAGGTAGAPAHPVRAALAFVLTLGVLAGVGVALHAGYTYALVVMVVAATVTGLAGGLGARTLTAIYTGAGRFVWLFLLFWLLDPMLVLIGKTGAYESVFGALKPVLPGLGPWLFLLLIVAIGYLHAVPGAAVAQVVLIDKLFGPVVAALGIPPAAWAVALLGTSQIDQLGPFPGADMVGQMGIAQSRDLRMMLVNGWAIMTTNTVLFLVLFKVLT